MHDLGDKRAERDAIEIARRDAVAAPPAHLRATLHRGCDWAARKRTAYAAGGVGCDDVRSLADPARYPSMNKSELWAPIPSLSVLRREVNPVAHDTAAAALARNSKAARITAAGWGAERAPGKARRGVDEPGA